jgi:hypothetical protein
MDLQEAWGFRMICKLDLSFPPALDLMSIRTLQGEILPLWPGYLPTLEVKPQSKLFSSPAASKESLVHPLYDTTPPKKKTASKTSLLPSLHAHSSSFTQSTQVGGHSSLFLGSPGPWEASAPGVGPGAKIQ